MAQSMKQLTPKNVRTMVTRLEKAAGRVEKEFERQLKALDQARGSMQREARKQIEAIRREQRGFLTRLKKAARTSSTSPPGRKTGTKKRSTARRSGPRTTSARTTPARRSTRARRSAA